MVPGPACAGRRRPLVACGRPVRRAGDAVEIHRDHVRAGGCRLSADAGLALALAAQSLSVSRGPDRNRRVLARPDLERAARLGLVPLPGRARHHQLRHLAPHHRRLHRPAIRAGRFRHAAGGADGAGADGMARLSHARARRDLAVDRGAGAVSLFPDEIADPPGRRHLADVHVAGRLRGGGGQPRRAVARELVGADDSVEHLLGQRGDRHRHRLRRDRVSLLRRRALEFPRQDRSGRRRVRL